MGYIEGFVAAVPTANKAAYKAHAEQAFAVFKSLGATRLVEWWGDDVPAGRVSDFPSAVQAKADETVVFSWLEYPDKATRDAANEKMRSDPATKKAVAEAMAGMPFDGKRMIVGGFAPLLDCNS